MTALLLVPVVLSILILAAHFLRTGNVVPVAAVLALLLLLAVRRRWAAWILQAALVLGAAEWARTLIVIAGHRANAGEPVLRLCLILGAVTLLTALSALVLRTRSLKAWFRAERRPGGTE